MASIKLTINEKPLSVNKAWQGRRFKSKDYTAYEKLLLAILPRKPKICGRVSVSILFHLKNDKRTDIDNLCKPLLDIIVKRGYIEDDRLIYRLTLSKKKAERDKIELEIEKYESL